jgi:enolase-phosphatase E1
MQIRAILTDIEGTTSSIAFVTDTLFPYARARMAAYVAEHGGDLAQLLGWMDVDAKEPALKDIQGRIWAQGYADGTLRGHVYPDAVAGLRRWHDAGLALYVFSSGSVAAQKLIFGHSVAGDLTPLFSGYFDTTTGPKREAVSYTKIADAIGMGAPDILFLSDTPAEIAAAREAGMQAILIDREGGDSDIARFDEVVL